MQAKAARLLCKGGATEGTRFDFTGEAILGRAPDCTVTLDASEISSRHARIAWDPDSGRYQLEDLGSLNGTELDGEPIRGHEALSRMHVITLGGSVEVIFQGPELCAAAQNVAPPQTGDSLEDRTDSHTMISAEPMVLPGSLVTAQDSDPAGGSGDEGTRIESLMAPLPAAFSSAPELAATEEDEATWRLLLTDQGPPGGFILQPGQNQVGRLPSCEVVIDGATISRLHATLTVHRGRLRVRDAGSRNGTWLDDQPVTEEVEVSSGAALRFGEVPATPEVAAAADSKEEHR